MSDTKKDCYSCKFRGTVPGSAHSSCKHPSITNPLAMLFKRSAPKELNIKANQYGIKSGWFDFPLDFDPTWLENCDGHTPKKAKT